MTAVRVVALVGWTLAVGGAAAGLLLRILDPVPAIDNAFDVGTPGLVALGFLGVTWATVGAVLMLRRPDHVVGRWVLLVGMGHGLSVFAASAAFSAAARDDTLELARWLGWTAGLATLLGSGIFYLAMIFPTGRGHTLGWDRAARAVLLLIGLTIAGVVTRPGPLHLMPTLGNPIGIGPDLGWLMTDQAAAIVAILGVCAFGPAVAGSMVSRYRAAGPVVRAQLRWFVSAILLTIASLGLAGLASVFRSGLGQAPIIAFCLAGSTVPVAIGIAILRYRLYDIDRLVSRTISWTLVSGILVGGFALAIVALQALLAGVTQGQTLAVAASTLLAFAAAHPLLQWVQTGVDRRFNRARYDARRTVDSFGERLRGEVAMDAVTRDLQATIDLAVRPAAQALWLREGPR